MQIFLHFIPYFLLGCLVGIHFVYLKIKIDNLESEVESLESKLDRNYAHICELKSILKEAGIIIEPPKNIEVPDPRGYSVKKVK